MLVNAPPGLMISILAILITSQVIHLAAPRARPRSYPAILFLSAWGFALGQAWDVLGLPSVRLGEASLLPGVGFAVMLSWAAPWLPVGPRGRALRMR